jgi:hypothetical protein
MIAPLPSNEGERLDALKRYEILDTGPEQAFDDITLLASQICKTEVATITFIDGGRQWFKSKVGTTMCETTRDLAFCAHGILQSETLVVENALEDIFRLGTPEPGYRINTEFHLRIPAGLSCSSRWSAPRRALIKSWFKAARNFRAVWEPAERRVSHGLRSNSRMTPPWDIEHVAVRASPLMRLT